MNKRISAVLLMVLVAGSVLLLLKRPPQLASNTISENRPLAEPRDFFDGRTNVEDNSRPPKTVTNLGRERYEGILSDPQWDWKRPINFFGKVVDETGAAVVGAEVAIYWANAVGAEQTAGRRTDAAGLFSLTDAKGRGISVIVSKKGYHTLKTQSVFVYADPSDRYFHRPNPDAPVIFRLQRKAQADPLVFNKTASRIAKDGTPIYLELLQGKVGAMEQGHIKLECWTHDTAKDSDKRYDWQCVISVHNGGLTERTNLFDFTAPLAGYMPKDRIEMPKELGADWRSEVQKDYFFKLENGLHGRLRLIVVAGGDHFFKIESFVNPSGSRNLEFDPAVQPKQTQFE